MSKRFWFLLYPCTFALLYLRYDWSAAFKPYSLRSFFISAFLLAVLLPTLHAMIRYVSNQPVTARAVTTLAAIAFSFPFRLFGIDSKYSKLYYPLQADWNTPGFPIPVLPWFPAAFKTGAVIPNELSFFLGFTVTVTLLGLLLARHFPKLLRFRGLFILIVVLVSFQTWAHLSMRSPYTYIPHYEQPAANHYWYQTYLFPNYQGAVNQDIHVFLPGESVFHGIPQPLAPLLTRAFPSYLASQGSAFFNSYYVWLVQNMFFWLLATLGIYYLALKFFSERAAFFAALLMASSQEIMVYVAQPKVYTSAICMLVIVLAFQQAWFGTQQISRKTEAAFTGLLFLLFLSYESQPWVIGIFVFALASGWNLKATARCLLLGLLLYYGYLALCRHLPEIAVGVTQTDIAGNPTQNIKKLLLSGNPFKILLRSLIALRGFGRCLVHCYQWTLLPAILGMIWVSRNARLRILALLLAPLLTYSYFELGENWYYTQFPRIVMLSYPAIYLLGGFALAEIWEAKKFANYRFGKVFVGGFMFLNVVYLNADVWGNPWIYYLWFYRHPGFSFGN